MNPFEALVRMIYPPKCVVCGAFIEDEKPPADRPYPLFCRSCLARWEPLSSPVCTCCGLPFSGPRQNDHLCGECTRKPPCFDALRAPFIYGETLTKAVHAFKYRGQEHLAKPFGRLLADYAARWLEASPPLLVMPVPLHPRRLRERGFNQSLLLARPVAKRLQADLDFLALTRVRYTQTQTGLGHADRRENVHEAFFLKRPASVKGRDVLLVDDVATTGNTLNECARILKKAGAWSVKALTLARAV
ncbi:ComF family protein [uncultured Desulfatiglans sp.]|uniref:ComF family protein n=1 Tax=Uncultured Desulfatiglans sp. TaxID=1748965 RepID=A0A653AE49_UNCDX|nr:ComF family protein [uncultured Desulfatiglans sp.]